MRIIEGDGVRPRALVVDADPGARAVVRELLEERAVSGACAASAADAIDQLRSRPVEMVIVDPDGWVGEPDVLRHALSLEGGPLVVVARAKDDGRAATWIGAGVFDVIDKPLDEVAARAALDRALRQIELLAELRRLRAESQSRDGYYRLVGRSAAMERVRAELERLADDDGPFWLSGESGSGKQVAARHVHRASRRSSAPFVVVTCASVGADTCWASAHGRGDTPGLLDQAAGGTAYLDDLSALGVAAQENLAATLEAAGGPDVRVVASAPVDPSCAAESGRVIDELAARIGVRSVALPPLRDRPEDIPLLARHFTDTVAEINHLPPLRLSSEALAALGRHAWPGNVRELRTAVEGAVLIATEGTILAEHLPPEVRREPGGPVTFQQSLSTAEFREAKRDVVEAFEQRYLRELMREHRGNVTAASQQAGMLRSALQRLLRKYGLKSVEFRKSAG